MNDIEAVRALKPLYRRNAKLRDRCVDRGDLTTADSIQVELDALHRAMAMLGNRHGQMQDGGMEVVLTEAELVELLALIRDEDGHADEQVLAELERRFTAVLRSIIRRQVTGAAA
jgi:polyhydroxyalkanoate synthesis regulator phasin